jgi:signal transduction histidine kinase
VDFRERVHTGLLTIPTLKDDRGEITGAINCFYDVTERKQAEEALRESVAERRRAEEALRENDVQLRLANEKLETVVQKGTASLRHLSAKLMRSQDEEHRRIARNLHDSLGQYLTSIKMNLESLRRSDAPNKFTSSLLDEVGFASAARW